MPPALVIPTNPIDLTTVQLVKAWLATQAQSEVPTSEDPLVQFAITAFSRYAQTLTGNKTLNSLTNFSEVYDGNNNDELFLRAFPITAISLVQVNSQVLQASAAFGQPGYYIGPTARSIRIRGGFAGDSFSTYYPTSFNLPFVFVKGRGNILVNYTAGNPPNVVTGEQQTIPATGAATLTVFNAPWQSDQGVTFVVGGASLVNVPNNPGPGQYSVSNGVYTFNTADAGKAVLINYTAGQAPSDLELAATIVVAETYRKRSWIGLKSRAMTGAAAGTTSYRDWTMPPECQEIFDRFKRYTY